MCALIRTSSCVAGEWKVEGHQCGVEDAQVGARLVGGTCVHARACVRALVFEC